MSKPIWKKITSDEELPCGAIWSHRVNETEPASMWMRIDKTDVSKFMQDCYDVVGACLTDGRIMGFSWSLGSDAVYLLIGEK